MRENLEKAYKQNGGLKVIDAALEVAFTGESWAEICQQAEQVTGCPRGLYRRLLYRAGGRKALDGLVRDAIKQARVSV